MGNSVTIEFDNTLSDHLAAERLYYQTTFWSKGDKVVAVLLVVAAILLTLAGHWWALVFFPLAIAEWFSTLSPSYLRTVLFFKRNPKFLETYRLTFSDSGIHFKTNSIDSNIAWTHYSKAIESERVFLLVYGTRMYTVIPKCAFRDKAQLNSFTELIHRQIRSDSADTRKTTGARIQ